MTAPALLRMRGVHVRHPTADRDALRDVALGVRPGEILALVGPNGSGKSTALATLGRALVPRLGDVELDGCAAAGLTARAFARRVARLPQTPSCPEGLTVWEPCAPAMRTVASWRRSGPTGAARRAPCADLLSPHRRLETLFGGERRRLARDGARQQAPLLLLDEPTAALDLRHQREPPRSCAASTGSAASPSRVVHDLEHAATDRVAVLHRGRLYAVGAPDEVIEQDTPRDVFGVDACVHRDADGCGAHPRSSDRRFL
jgi:iron complex transport system ATP-binding protein